MTAFELLLNRFLWHSTRRERVGLCRRIAWHYGNPLFYSDIPPRTRLFLYRLETALGARY